MSLFNDEFVAANEFSGTCQHCQQSLPQLVSQSVRSVSLLANICGFALDGCRCAFLEALTDRHALTRRQTQNIQEKRSASTLKVNFLFCKTLLPNLRHAVGKNNSFSNLKSPHHRHHCHRPRSVQASFSRGDPTGDTGKRMCSQGPIAERLNSFPLPRLLFDEIISRQEDKSQT